MRRDECEGKVRKVIWKWYNGLKEGKNLSDLFNEPELLFMALSYQITSFIESNFELEKRGDRK